jgi:hypothetical protein
MLSRANSGVIIFGQLKFKPNLGIVKRSGRGTVMLLYDYLDDRMIAVLSSIGSDPTY